MPPVAPQDAASEPREPVRLGTLIGAGAAALCSVALMIWASTGGRELGPETKPAAPPKPPAAHAAPTPDAEQVRQAYAQVRDVYGETGLRGVVDFSEACRQSVAAAPHRLDFCVAFALDAAALAANSGDRFVKAWSGQVAAEQLALIRSALPPGADPAARLAAVQQLTRALVTPPAAPQVVRPAPQVVRPAPPRPARVIHRRPVRPRAATAHKPPLARAQQHRNATQKPALARAQHRKAALKAAAAKRYRVAKPRPAAAAARLDQSLPPY